MLRIFSLSLKYLGLVGGVLKVTSYLFTRASVVVSPSVRCICTQGACSTFFIITSFIIATYLPRFGFITDWVRLGRTSELFFAIATIFLIGVASN